MAPEPAALATLAEDLHELADSADAAHRAATAATTRSTRSLRDELRRLSDGGSTIEVYCADGSEFTGTVEEIGLDYLVLAEADQTRLIALFHVVAVRCRGRG